MRSVSRKAFQENRFNRSVVEFSASGNKFLAAAKILDIGESII
jgi:hypothetical protein